MYKIPEVKRDSPTIDIFDIHDRFAIMDDEIIHFGSTLGGHVPQLTAFSIGWEDKDEKFKKYALKLINESEKINRGA